MKGFGGRENASVVLPQTLPGSPECCEVQPRVEQTPALEKLWLHLNSSGSKRKGGIQHPFEIINILKAMHLRLNVFIVILNWKRIPQSNKRLFEKLQNEDDRMDRRQAVRGLFRVWTAFGEYYSSSSGRLL